MEKLLFESAGVSKKYKLVNTVCSIVLILLGIFVLIMRNMKRRSVGVSISAGGNLIDTGNLGGGYIISDDARNTLMIVGVIVILLGILFFCNMFSSNKSYVKIYEDRIVGLSCAGVILFTIKKNYDIKYDQIENLQIVRNSLFGDSISVKAQGERYGILVRDKADEAYRIIMQRIGEMRQMI